MKRNKIKLLIAFLIFMIFPLSLVLSSIASNSMSGPTIASCDFCHSPTPNISLVVLNQTQVNASHGATNLKICFYASTSLTTGALTVRFLVNPSGDLTFTPDVESGGSGIVDGDSNDPDGIPNEQIGDVNNPAIVTISNVPDNDASYNITVAAFYYTSSAYANSTVVTINVGAGGEIEEPEPWEVWFARQLPIIVGILIVFSVAIVASVVIKRGK